MILIVAVDENWGIGKDGQLLARLSQDMKFFRAKTTGNVVVMGRKTLESLPKKQPLPERTNLVLTGNTSYSCENAIICHSIEDVLTELKNHSDREVFIIGGGTVYEQFLPYCDTAYITKLHHGFEADTYLTNLDTATDWQKITESEIYEEKGVPYSFLTYKRIG